MAFDKELITIIASIVGSLATAIGSVFLIAPRMAVLRAKAEATNASTFKEANESVNKQINRLDERLDLMGAQLSERDAIIAEMSSSILTLRRRIVSLEADIIQKDTQIEKLRGANNDLNNRLKVTNDLLNAHIETIAVMETKLEELEDIRHGVEILVDQIVELNEIPKYKL